MKLVIAKPSPYARKARIALLEKRIPFEMVIDVPWNRPSFASTIPEPQQIAEVR
jgi:glutathione S-transferase